jgi:hypothetical protein
MTVQISSKGQQEFCIFKTDLMMYHFPFRKLSGEHNAEEMKKFLNSSSESEEDDTAFPATDIKKS